MLIKELIPIWRFSDDLAIRYIKNLDQQAHLLFFALSREKWEATVKLSYDAPEAPHINSCVVRNPQHDFWSSIEPRLDVCIHYFVHETTTPEIDYFYP